MSDDITQLRLRRLVERHFPEYRAGGFTRLDTTVAFYTRISALLRPESIVLDFGAGRGRQIVEGPPGLVRNLCTVRGKVRRVIGVDPDPAVLSNPGLDEAHLLELAPDGSFRLPLPDASVDLVIADWVFEHVADPATTARELARVLVPGGWIAVRTPNRWGYIATGNRLVPERLKGTLLSRLQPKRREEDVFPALYRLNTRADLERHFPPHQWYLATWNVPVEPAYAGTSSVLWALFRLVDKLTPPVCRPVLLAFLQKRPDAFDRTGTAMQGVRA